MSDFLDRYGEQLKHARERRQRRGLRGFGAGRPRRRHHSLAAALGAVALVGAMLMLAFTGSTTRKASQTRVDVASATPPENEALEHANGATPDEFSDFRLSSN